MWLINWLRSLFGMDKKAETVAEPEVLPEPPFQKPLMRAKHLPLADLGASYMPKQKELEPLSTAAVRTKNYETYRKPMTHSNYYDNRDKEDDDVIPLLIYSTFDHRSESYTPTPSQQDSFGGGSSGGGGSSRSYGGGSDDSSSYSSDSSSYSSCDSSSSCDSGSCDCGSSD